jgi:hypothetical protein
MLQQAALTAFERPKNTTVKQTAIKKILRVILFSMVRCG